jgi:hypothetical protein
MAGNIPLPLNHMPLASLPPLLLPQSEDKALRLVNHMWHIMVREEGNEKINSEIADWVLARA